MSEKQIKKIVVDASIAVKWFNSSEEFGDAASRLKPEIPSDQAEYVTLSEKGKEMIDDALEAEKKGDIIGPFSNIKEALKALKES